MSKKFSRNLVVVCLLICLVFLVANFAQAITLEVGLDYGQKTGLGQKDVRVTIAQIIQVALGILGVVALVLVVYGGVLLLTSNQETEKLVKAKKVFISALTGFLIILISFVITTFILQQLLKATGVQMVGQAPANTNETQNTNSNSNGNDDGGTGLPLVINSTAGFSVVDPTVADLGTFSVNNTLVDFYSYSAASTHININANLNMLAPQRTVSFVYADTSNPAETKFYLINVHGTVNQGSGQFKGYISNAKDYFTFALRDDYGWTYPCSSEPTTIADAYGDCGDKLYYQNNWATCCTDGEAIYLGNGSEPLSFKINVTSFTPKDNAGQPLAPEWWLYSPSNPNGILIAQGAQSFPASVDVVYQPKP